VIEAVADELGYTPNAVEKWNVGDRYPPTAKVMLEKLDRLSKQKPPKKRRYARGSRRREVTNHDV
jgi:hypothetical protein|tara:strand:+ start:71 stop:265 length:195 start_codon:yes stop_codon:yes gene_type:complete